MLKLSSICRSVLLDRFEGGQTVLPEFLYENACNNVNAKSQLEMTVIEVTFDWLTRLYETIGGHDKIMTKISESDLNCVAICFVHHPEKVASLIRQPIRKMSQLKKDGIFDYDQFVKYVENYTPSEKSSLPKTWKKTANSRGNFFQRMRNMTWNEVVHTMPARMDYYLAKDCYDLMHQSSKTYLKEDALTLEEYEYKKKGMVYNHVINEYVPSTVNQEITEYIGRKYSGYLFNIPDYMQDDDHSVTVYCRTTEDWIDKREIVCEVKDWLISENLWSPTVEVNLDTEKNDSSMEPKIVQLSFDDLDEKTKKEMLEKQAKEELREQEVRKQKLQQFKEERRKQKLQEKLAKERELKRQQEKKANKKK